MVPALEAQAISSKCGYADAGSGPSASAICWIDWSQIDLYEARYGGHRMTIALDGGGTLSFVIKIEGDTVVPSKTPTYGAAPIGNDTYLNIPGLAALYQDGDPGGLTDIILEEIEARDAGGNPVTQFEIVGADAETTDARDGTQFETVEWKSSGGTAFRLISNIDGSCRDLFNGVGTEHVQCIPHDSEDGSGAVVVSVKSPTLFKMRLRAEDYGQQAGAVGIMLASVSATKTFSDRVSATDSADVVVSGPTSAEVARASTGSGDTASTGSVQVFGSQDSQATYTFSEVATPGNSIDLSKYDKQWSCTRTTTTSMSPQPVDVPATGDSVSVAVEVGDDVSCSVTNTPKKVPALSIDKTTPGLVGNPTAGQAFTYQLVVSNTGQVDATGTTVSDAVPDGLQVISTTPTATVSGQQVSWTNQTIPQQGSQTYSVTVRAKTVGPKHNVATVIHPDACPASGAVAACSDAVDVTVDELAGVLTTDKRATQVLRDGNPVTERPRLGDVISYEIVTTNTSAHSMTNVTVSDDLLGDRLTCDKGQGATLAPAGRVTCTGSYTVLQGDVDSGNVHNETMSTAQWDPNDPTAPAGAIPAATDTEDVTTDRGDSTKGLDVDKSSTIRTGGSVAKEGDWVDYTVTITNTSPLTAPKVEASDSKYDLSKAVCHPALGLPLAPGKSIECTYAYQMTADDAAEGAILNTATATSGSDDIPSGNDDDEVVLGGLQTTKTVSAITRGGKEVSAPVKAGDEITYKVVTTNTSGYRMVDVMVEDTLLGADLTCNPAIPAALDAKQPVTCTGTYTVLQQDVNNGTVHNVATSRAQWDASVPVEPGTPVPGGQDETKTAADRGDGKGLDVHKSSVIKGGGTVAQEGNVIDYTITITNLSQLTATNVQLSDSKYDISKARCTPSLGSDLDPGKTIECTYPYTVTATDAAAGQVLNTATATTSNPDVPGGKDDDEVVLGGLQTVKTVSKIQRGTSEVQAPAQAGDLITYSVTTTNTSKHAMVDVSVSDPLLGTTLNCAPPVPVAKLAGKASIACVGTYTVAQRDVDAGNIHNTATATGRWDPDDPVSPDEAVPPSTAFTDTDTDQGDGTKGLNVDKSSVIRGGATVAKQGDWVDYTITITNTSPLTAPKVEASDSKYDLSTAKCTPVLGSPLAPGQSMVCEYPYQVSDADATAGKILNTVTATSGDDHIPGGKDDDEVALGGLVTTKAVTRISRGGQTASAPVQVGDIISYSVGTTNTSAYAMVNVSVSDPLLGTTFSCDPGVSVPKLPGKGSITCTGTYTVKQGDVDDGEVHNVATSAGTWDPDDPITPDGQVPGGKDETTTPADRGDLSKGLHVDKRSVIRDGGEIARLGNIIDYTVTITNTADVTATEVTLEDTKYDASEADCRPKLGSDLKPGESIKCRYSYTVTSSDVAAGQIHNKATASSTTPDLPDGSDEDDVVLGGLRTVKTVTKIERDGKEVAAPAQLGDVISYSVVTTNTSARAMVGVTVTDSLLGKDLRCTPAVPVAKLDGLDLVTCTGTHKVTQEDVDARNVHNDATSSGRWDPADKVAPDGPVPGGSDSTDTETSPGDPSKGLVVDKTSTIRGADKDTAKVAQEGDWIDYTITITNTSGLTAREVTASDSKYPLDHATCEVPLGSTLAPGGVMTCVYSYQVTAADAVAGEVLNTATATTTTPDLPGGKDDDKVPLGELVTTKRVTTITRNGAVVDKPVRVGDLISYSVVTTNTSARTMVNVAVEDPLLGDQFSCIPSASVARLAGQDTIVCLGTYTVQQQDVDDGQVRNSATSTGEWDPADPLTPDGDVPGGYDETVTPALPADTTLGLDVVKTSKVRKGGLVAQEGDWIDYQVVITNSSGYTAVNVQLTDSKYPMSAAACQPELGSDLAPGGLITCKYSYQVTAQDAASGQIHNVATATNSNPEVPTGTDDDTVALGGLETVKSVTTIERKGREVPEPVQVGDVITYAVTTTNTSARAMVNVSVQDPMLGSTFRCEPGATVTKLPGLGSVTCTGTYTVQQADVDAELVRNTTTSNGSWDPADPLTPDGSVPEARDEITTDTDTGTGKGLRVDKSSTLPGGGLVAHEGELIDYTVTITNDSVFTALNVRATDSKFDLTTATCIPALGSDLAPGGFITCTYQYQVTAADAQAGQILNTATATNDNPNVPGGKDDDEKVVGGLITHKTVTGILRGGVEAQQPVQVGDVISYKVVATNTTSHAMVNVQVKDDLLGAALTCTPTVPVARLAGKTSVECLGSYTVKQKDVDRATVRNVATSTGVWDPDDPLTPDGPVPSSQDSTDTPADQGDGFKGLDVDKVSTISGGGQVAREGDVIDYVITITNTAPVTATKVTASDSKYDISRATCTPGLGADLAPHDSIVCRYSYRVSKADAEAGQVFNTATAHSENPKVPDGEDDDELPVGGLVTVKSVAKIVRDGEEVSAPVAAGDVITYSVVTTNSSAYPMVQVDVQDGLLGDALACNPGVPGASLAAHGTITCTGQYAVTQADIDRGSVTNVATSAGEWDPSVPVEPGTTVPGGQDETVTPADQGDLSKGLDVSKLSTIRGGGEVARAGNIIDYTVTITNLSKLTARNVQATDTKYDLASAHCEPSLGSDLLPGKSIVCTYAYTVSAQDATDGKVLNEVTATDDNPLIPDGEDDDELPVGGLETHKTVTSIERGGRQVSAPVQAGDVITYAVKTTNTSGYPMVNVTVTDELLGTDLTCDRQLPGPLPGHGTITCAGTYKVTQADVDAGQVTNVATSAGEWDPSVPVDPGTVVPGGKDETTTPTDRGDGSKGLDVDKKSVIRGGGTTARQGDVIDYTITVTNSAPLTATAVQVTDTKVDLAQATCTPALGSDLAPGQQLVCTYAYTVTAQDAAAGQVLNTATATSTNPDVPDGKGDDEKPVGGLETSKTVTHIAKAPGNRLEMAEPGDTLTYGLTVANTSAYSIVDVTLTDPLPGLSPLTCDTAMPATLAPHTKLTCTATYVVTDADGEAGKVLNTATAAGTWDPQGPVDPGKPVPPAPASADTPIDPIAPGDLLVVKRADKAAYRAGDTVRYTVNVKNMASDPALFVKVTDKLPKQLAFVATSDHGTYDPAAHAVTWELGTVGPGQSVSLTLETTVRRDATGTIVNVALAETPGGCQPARADKCQGTSTSTIAGRDLPNLPMTGSEAMRLFAPVMAFLLTLGLELQFLAHRRKTAIRRR